MDIGDFHDNTCNMGFQKPHRRKGKTEAIKIMRNFSGKILLSATVAMTLIVLPGCKSTPPKSNVIPTRSPVKAFYPKLKDYSLELNAIVPGKALVPGEASVINFKLRNAGFKPVQIDEWYQNDSDNLRIYYRPYTDGINFDKFDKKEWKCIEPELTPPTHHYVLVISPNNIVFFEKKIDFYKKISAADLSQNKKFLIIGELALNSVDVRSSPFAINLK